MPRRINYKARIIDVLTIERVAYGMEIARRIDVFEHRTIKFVLKRMWEAGEIEKSGVVRVGKNLRMIFYYLPNTDGYTVTRVIEFKKHLFLDHCEYSNVQKNFGPKIAISSLKDLADNNLVSLVSSTIEGPISKWAGPKGIWRNSEVAVAHGDIDVVALERTGNVMWIGEVKMREDVLTESRAVHFLATATRFRERVYEEKGVYYNLKPFILVPLAATSTRIYCRRQHIELMECQKAYYPEKTAKRELGDFYRTYRTVLGCPNLEIIKYEDLPLDVISDGFRARAFRGTV